MAYKAVIFDFGGVFTPSPIELFERFEKARGLPERFIGGVIKRNHLENAWARYERAEIGLDDFDHLFAAESKACGHEVRGGDVVRLLTFSVRPEMIAALHRVKNAGLRTGCITNNLPAIDWSVMLSGEQGAYKAAEIFSLFDEVIESAKAGVRKPDPRIYAMMCENLGVDPGMCIFLDDLGINLKPAREMGMATIKVPLYDPMPAIEELDRLIATTVR